MNQYYFSNIWSNLNQIDKEKILDIVSQGKGALPYEKIININSLKITPQNEFFDHTEFYSKLNGSNVSLEIYDNMKYL